MNPVLKLIAYGLVLAASFGAGAAVGAVAGPIDVSGRPAQETHDEPAEPGEHDFGGH